MYQELLYIFYMYVYVKFFFSCFNLRNCITRKKKLEAKVKKLEGNWHCCCLTHEGPWSLYKSLVTIQGCST